jgi:hypothetical protein
MAKSGFRPRHRLSPGVNLITLAGPFVTDLPLLVVPTEGQYLIRLSLEGKELVSLPLWAEPSSAENDNSASDASAKGTV